MRVQSVAPTGVGRVSDPDEIIVSRADPKGIITCTNRALLREAG